MTSSAGSAMRTSSSPNRDTAIERNGLESPIYAPGATPSGRKRKASETPITNIRPERRKITRACDSCKRKKIRCTGTLPCLRCTRLSLPCEYKAAYSRGLPPSPLLAPESMLRHVVDSRNNSSSPAFTEKAPWTPATSVLSVSHSSQSCSSSSSHSLKSEQNSQSQFATPPPPVLSPRSSPEPGSTTDLEGNYLGPTSGISFLNRVWRRLHLHQDQDDVNVSTTIPPSPSPLQQHEAAYSKNTYNTSVFMFGDRPFVDRHTEAGFVLPPLDKALELVGIYFDFSIVTYRFLHRGTVEAWVREVYESNNVSSPMNLPSSSFGSNNLVARAAIVFMVFAVATMHEERRPGSTCTTGDDEECNESERWYIASKHMSSLETGPPKLETIQARLGQCLYLLSSSRANECWYAFGTALQLVTALGLHRKQAAATKKLGKTAGTTTAYLEHELRKRVFWSAYTIDKYLSVMFGRPRSLHDEDIDQELPDVVDDEDIVMEPELGVGVGLGLGLGLERQCSRQRQKQEVESADCMMIAANLHFRLARILSEISRQVYTIRPSSKTSPSPLEAALHLTSELEKWKDSVPPIFSSVRASSLIPPLCRQSHVLRLAYSHAVIHATRSFLLSNFTTDLGNRRRREGGSTVTRDKIKTHVQKCIFAAKDVMTLVVSLADQGILVQSFWFTHYVCFCAIIVMYIYTIQEYRRCPLSGSASAPSGDETTTRSLFNLAESCQHHLAKATQRNCPSRRYSIILEELRVEVHRWIAAHDLRTSATGVGTGTAEKDTLRDAQHGAIVVSEQQQQQQKASAPSEAENQHPVSLESCNAPNHTPIPMSGELIQLQAPVLEANDDSGQVQDLDLVLPENWEGSSTWWTQLDSWAFSGIGNDASTFIF